MPPSREEWALAIAEHFFTPDKQDQTVLLDVDESVLRRISDQKGWNLEHPVADHLAATLAQNHQEQLFWNHPPLTLDQNGGDYHDLPTGLADFALGMVIANRHFASQTEWSRAFNPLVGIVDTRSIFNSQQAGTNRNLRTLLHSIHEWCEVADMGDIPPLPPHTRLGCDAGACKCAWGGWGYIGKFYDHLETTREDKRTFLYWINETMRTYDWLDYEDLIDEKDCLRRTLYSYSSEFSDRLQQWLNHRVLNEKFWALVDNYLRHLIDLRDNPRQRTAGAPGPQGDDLEEEEVSSIVERKDSIRPIIWVDRQMNGLQVEYSLGYHIEDMGQGTKVELDGDKLDLPLDGEDAARAVGRRRIHVDGTPVVQKFTGLHPLCVLVEEDSTLKSRHMLENPEHAGVPGGSEFHLLCFGSGAYDAALDIIERLTDGRHPLPDIVVQGSHSLPDTPTRDPDDSDDPRFGPFHAETVFLFRNLERNWENHAVQDPPQLRFPKSGSSLMGIRHHPRSDTFHTFGGHPEMVVSPPSGQQTDGDPALVDLGAGRFRVIQDMLSAAGAQTPISKEYEWRAIRRDEMSLNDPVPRDEFGSVTQTGSMIQPQQADLQEYSDEARKASADMPRLAEDHGHRIFLNDDKPLSETIDSESRFPLNSPMRGEWEDKAQEALSEATIDGISDTLARTDSDYVDDNRSAIVDFADQGLSRGQTPRSGLKGLYELGQRGARVNQDTYERHLQNMAGQSTFYDPLVDELEQFDEVPQEVADAIRDFPPVLFSEFSEQVSKLRMMQRTGGYDPDEFDSEIQDLIDMDPIRKPWRIEQSANRDEALELIDSLASVAMKNQSRDAINFMRAWTDYYNALRGCIERCDHKGLEELNHTDYDRNIQSGTAWVRLSKELVGDSSLTGWTNPDEAREMGWQCRRKYDSVRLHHFAKQVIERRFSAIGRSLDFIQQLPGV